MNYEKILKMMQAVDWQYRCKPVTLEEIKDTAIMVEREGVSTKSNISCGGFLYLYNERKLYFIGDQGDRA